MEKSYIFLLVHADKSYNRAGILSFIFFGSQKLFDLPQFSPVIAQSQRMKREKVLRKKLCFLKEENSSVEGCC